MTIEPKETEEASTGRLNVKTIRSFSGQTAPFDTLIDSSRNGPADAPPPPPPPPPPQAQSAAARRGRTRGPGRKGIREKSTVVLLCAFKGSARRTGRPAPGAGSRGHLGGPQPGACRATAPFSRKSRARSRMPPVATG